MLRDPGTDLGSQAFETPYAETGRRADLLGTILSSALRGLALVRNLPLEGCHISRRTTASTCIVPCWNLTILFWSPPAEMWCQIFVEIPCLSVLVYVSSI